MSSLTPLEIARSFRRFGVRRGAANMAWMMPSHGTARLHCGAGGRVLVRRDGSDWETFSEVFLDECYSDRFLALFGGDPRPEDVRTVVDVGANVGYASRFFAARYPNADVVALEPDARNFELLTANCASEPRIRPVLGALWKRREAVSVVDASAAHNSLQVAELDGGGEPVQGYSMRDLFELAGTDVIDVLKIDIEGAERVVFESAPPDVFDGIRTVMIELHDWKEHGSSHAFHAALDGFDYDQFAMQGVIATRIHGRASQPPG